MSTLPTLPWRLWQKIRVEQTPNCPVPGLCWVWTGSGAKRKGYGWALYEKRAWGSVHRLTYTLLVGPIPAGLQLDHLCRRTLCVNPEHLEPVTARENRRRSLEALGRLKPSVEGPAA